MHLTVVLTRIPLSGCGVSTFFVTVLTVPPFGGNKQTNKPVFLFAAPVSLHRKVTALFFSLAPGTEM